MNPYNDPWNDSDMPPDAWHIDTLQICAWIWGFGLSAVALFAIALHVVRMFV